MDEQAIRAIVRQAVARQLGAERAVPAAPSLDVTSHVSHIRYLLPESDGPCLIEPTVPCNHCGYCQSHGH
jgi:predicted Zn-ribbon and HTH transcriptional regulator